MTMKKYRLVNTKLTGEREIRIYQLDQTGQIVAPVDFTKIDPLGQAVGIVLSDGYAVNCTGALNNASLDISLRPGAAEVPLIVMKGEDGVRHNASDLETMVTVLETEFGLKVYDLPQWAGTAT